MVFTSLRKTFPWTTCVVVLTMLAACSSAGKTTVEVKKTQEIPPSSTASLQVSSSTKKPYGHQFEIEQRIQQDLSAGLVNAGVFKSVARSLEQPDYRIDLRIERVRIRSPASRVLFGFMAGRSYIQAHVDVHETRTNSLITAFRILGAGAKTVIGAQSYGYDDPVREVVNKVILSLR